MRSMVRLVALLLGLGLAPAWATKAVVEPADDLEGELELAEAEEVQPEEEAKVSWFTFDVELTNLFLYMTDSDFDGMAREYDEDGQSVGVLATYLRPTLVWSILENLRILYQAEVGLNVWSLNNPDQGNFGADDSFIMKHRQIYGEGFFLDGHLGFRVGYQYLQDPTGLFVAHWMGAASLMSQVGSLGLTLTVGQIPDPTYEGFRIDDNNFSHDTFVFALRADWGLGSGVELTAGAYGLLDQRLVDRTIWVIQPCVAFWVDLGDFRFGLDGAFQGGQLMGHAVDGSDQTHLAWAAQLHGIYGYDNLLLSLNLLALSPDDQYDGNTSNHAFFYSGKNRSLTMMLTEDELRDRFNNLDERLATNQGGFFLVRPGLLVADLKVSYTLFDIFVPSIIVGGAMVAEARNSLDQRFVGLEADLDLAIVLRDYLELHVVGGFFLPGGAAAALVNTMDLAAQRPLFMVESALILRY